MLNVLKRNPFEVLLYGVTLVMSILVYYLIQKWGVSIGPDSVSYLNGALDISAGKGYHSFHWPPGYSFILALFYDVSNLPIVEVGYFLNPTIYFLTLLSFYHLIKLVALDKLLVFFVVILFGISFPFVSSVLSYESEYIFILFLLGYLRMSLLYLKNGNKINYLLYALCFYFLMYMVRYSAMGFIPVVLIVALMGKKNKLRRFILLLFCIGGFTALYAVIVGNEIPKRTFHLDFLPIVQYLNLFGVPIRWFFRMDLMISMTILSIVVFRKLNINKHLFHRRFSSVLLTKPELVVLLGFLGYSGFLVLAKTVLYHNIPFNDRILSPMLPLFLILLSKLFEGRRMRWLFTLFIISSAQISASELIRINQNDYKLNHTSWLATYQQLSKDIQNSDTVAEIYTNNLSALNFFKMKCNGKFVVTEAPRRQNGFTFVENSNFSVELDSMILSLKKPHTEIVLFHRTFEIGLLEYKHIKNHIDLSKHEFYYSSF